MELLLLIFVVWLFFSLLSSPSRCTCPCSLEEYPSTKPRFWRSFYTGEERRFKKTWADPYDNE